MVDLTFFTGLIFAFKLFIAFLFWLAMYLASFIAKIIVGWLLRLVFHYQIQQNHDDKFVQYNKICIYLDSNRYDELCECEYDISDKKWQLPSFNEHTVELCELFISLIIRIYAFTVALKMIDYDLTTVLALTGVLTYTTSFAFIPYIKDYYGRYSNLWNKDVKKGEIIRYRGEWVRIESFGTFHALAKVVSEEINEEVYKDNPEKLNLLKSDSMHKNFVRYKRIRWSNITEDDIDYLFSNKSPDKKQN